MAHAHLPGPGVGGRHAACLPATAASTDSWLGGDKALHFSSAGVAAGGYNGAALFSDDTRVRLGLGGALALSVGVGKELWDLTEPRRPSLEGSDLGRRRHRRGACRRVVIDRLLFTSTPLRAISRRPSLDLGKSPFCFHRTRREILAQ